MHCWSQRKSRMSSGTKVERTRVELTKPSSRSTFLIPSLTVFGSNVISTLLQLLSISSLGFQPSRAAGLEVPTR